MDGCWYEAGQAYEGRGGRPAVRSDGRREGRRSLVLLRPGRIAGSTSTPTPASSLPHHGLPRRSQAALQGVPVDAEEPAAVLLGHAGGEGACTRSPSVARTAASRLPVLTGCAPPSPSPRPAEHTQLCVWPSPAACPDEPWRRLTRCSGAGGLLRSSRALHSRASPQLGHLLCSSDRPRLTLPSPSLWTRSAHQRGPPDSVYEGGEYHGLIMFPGEPSLPPGPGASPRPPHHGRRVASAYLCCPEPSRLTSGPSPSLDRRRLPVQAAGHQAVHAVGSLQARDQDLHVHDVVPPVDLEPR